VLCLARRLRHLLWVQELFGALLLAYDEVLAIQRLHVVIHPEHGEEPVVGDTGGIVLDLHDLGVPGAPGADVLVGGVPETAAGVADGRRYDALDLLKSGLDPPEAAGSERRLLHAREHSARD